MSKIKEFLQEGNEVKIVINGNKKLMAKHPDSMDRTTLKLLERVEGLVSSVKQPAVKLGEFRKDFILTPKAVQ
jgi:translation initiation factor IF-3